MTPEGIALLVILLVAGAFVIIDISMNPSSYDGSGDDK